MSVMRFRLMLLSGMLAVVGAAGCTAPNPNYQPDAAPDGAPAADARLADAKAVDASADAAADAAFDAAPDAAFDAAPDAFVCTADEFRRCEGGDAIFCNATGDDETTQSCGSFGCNDTAGRCNECTPSTATCNGNTLSTCSAAGLVTTTTCALGCNSAGDHCNDVDPSNGLAVYLDMAASEPGFVIPLGSTINTNTGAVTDDDGNAMNISNALVPAPSGGEDIRVFFAKSFAIDSVTITGDPAVAFVADGDIEVRGDLEVDAGQHFASGCAHSLLTVCAINMDCPGFGGAAFGGQGGDGGEADGDPGTAGGSPYGNASLVPLIGGCNSDSGGAVQLVSRTEIRMLDLGFVDVNGSGVRSSRNNAGSGGGALLEAPVVKVESNSGIASNGGGGAGGCPSSGQDGRLSTSAASGASCPGDGSGGDGGALGVAAQDGTAPSAGSHKGGGGGGGVGRIRINVLGGGYQPANDAVVSPTPSIGSLKTR